MQLPPTDHQERWTLPQYQQWLQTLPASYFAPLFELLPAMRVALPRGPSPLTEEADGTYTYAPVQAHEAGDFIKRIYALHLVIPFDWNDWAHAVPFHKRPHLIDGFGPLECVQALTVLTRGDRFSDGLVQDSWNKGLLARLVGRLEKVVTQEV